MSYKKPQAAKLVEMSKERSNELSMKVREVIEYCLANNDPISLNKVARLSNVSRQAIYSRPELKELIDYYGKYVQGSMQLTEKDLLSMPDIPRLNELEEKVNKLLEENKALNKKLFKLKNRLFALEHNIDV